MRMKILKGLRQFNYNLISKFTNLDQYIQQIDGGQHYRDRFNDGILKILKFTLS